jgi:hypothetical protein
MKEGYNFNSSILISFEFKESAACEELSALGRESAAYIYKLIIVDPLSAIIR